MISNIIKKDYKIYLHIIKNDYNCRRSKGNPQVAGATKRELATLYK